MVCKFSEAEEDKVKRREAIRWIAVFELDAIFFDFDRQLSQRPDRHADARSIWLSRAGGRLQNSIYLGRFLHVLYDGNRCGYFLKSVRLVLAG